MSLSAVIVDDEQLARDELAFLLKDVGDVDVVAQGKNGLEGVNLIREHNPDLVFLDVQMPGLDGFGVIKKLLDKKIPLPKIVFSTAFDQYAVKAFEVNAVDYLLKPFDKKRVAQSVQKVRAKMESGSASTDKLETLVRLLESQKPQASKILIKAGGRLFLVNQKDIGFASIEEGVITVVTSGANGIEGQSNCRTLEELLRIGLRPCKLQGLSYEAVAQLLQKLSHQEPPASLVHGVRASFAAAGGIALLAVAAGLWRLSARQAASGGRPGRP
jgi:DNA-binding LytR/AlgR family response regulator